MRLWQKIKESTREIQAILWLAIAALILVSIYVTDKGVEFTSNYFVGFFGTFIARIFTGLFGEARYLLPIMILFYGVMLFKVKNPKNISGGFFLAIITIATSLHLTIATDISVSLDYFKEAMDGHGGGLIGASFAIVIVKIFGLFGSYIIVITSFLLSIILITNINLSKTFTAIINIIKNTFLKIWSNLSGFFIENNNNDAKKTQKKNKKKLKKNEHPIVHIYDDPEDEDYDNADLKEKTYLKKQKNASKEIPIEIKTQRKEKTSENEEESNNYEHVAISNYEEDVTKKFKLPPISLLQKNIKVKNPRMNKDISEKVKQLETTLSSFGVNGKVSQVSCGPVITRFEIYPERGTKVSKIVNLADDIALNLAVSQVRIEAPIPGKAAVGIEIPNKEIDFVHLRDVLESAEYQNIASKLSVALGMDISGKVVVSDLTKMPHLLIAGATGSGKSVCMNSLICSLLFKALPSELKLIIIDPKMVELTNFNGIPHLLAPVVTDPKKAATALKWMVNEMENRYEIFAASGVKDISRYNNLKAEENPKISGLAMPYVVILIDELADLMSVAPADVEDAICRLAQMARAAGIHLVVATQRPSVDVITGLIKANIPSRIAFAVSSQTDSRTILDVGGAEKLLGQGDMLYYPIGSAKPLRIQGVFVSDKEVDEIVNFLKMQGVPKYENILEEKKTETKRFEQEDDLLPEATRLIIESNQASISLLQRRLRIGYTRAARLIDLLEEKGIVGPYEGSKPRAVLINWDEYEDIFKEF